MIETDQKNELAPLTLTGLAGLDGIRHGFFTREGGVSGGIYGSLNCGPGSEDDAAHVAENRIRVASTFGENRTLNTLYQVHGTDVVILEEPLPEGVRPKADAMVTRQPGVVLGVLTADCGPILFADPDARVIGAAHAGWGGALGGVMDTTLKAMERLGADRKSVIAGIGPCITALSYEVGPEFHARFVAAHSLYNAYFQPSGKADHYRFDLPGFIEMRLRWSGVSRVERLELCTCLDEQRFFSNRRRTHRSEPDYGRQVSAIMLEEG